MLLALVIGTLAAFGFSRYPLKGNDTYLFIILTTRMLPAIVVIIPMILMFRAVGLSGSYPGIILLYTAFNLAFTIWMMKSFFDELSRDVEDAARIDGSSEIRVFFKICLPQVVAGLAATFVFGLILTWNEFLFALLAHRRRHPHRASGHEPGRVLGRARHRLDAAGRHRDPVPHSRLPRHLLPAEPPAAWRHLRHGEALAMSTIDIRKITKKFGDVRRRPGCRSVGGGRRGRLPARPLGLRQDHDPAHDRRPRAGHGGRYRDCAGSA